MVPLNTLDQPALCLHLQLVPESILKREHHMCMLPLAKTATADTQPCNPSDQSSDFAVYRMTQLLGGSCVTVFGCLSLSLKREGKHMVEHKYTFSGSVHWQQEVGCLVAFG